MLTPIIARELGRAARGCNIKALDIQFQARHRARVDYRTIVLEVGGGAALRLANRPFYIY